MDNKDYLSNWYEHKVRINGRVYWCVAQYLAYEMALAFSEWDTANDILNSNDKDFIERAVSNYHSNYGLWKSMRREVMMNALTQKFKQCEECRIALVEANFDEIAEVIDFPKWESSGENYLAECLFELKAITTKDGII